MAQQKVCPGLGLSYDRSDHRTFANPLHYCYLQTRPDVILSDHQEKYCLTENYVNCPIYQNKSQFNAPVPTPIAAQNQKPDQPTSKLSNLQSLTILTVFLSFLLVVLLVLIFTSPNLFGQADSSSAEDPMAVVTFIITPTQITPDAAYYAQLTLQAMQNELLGTPTLISDLFPTRTSIAFLSPTPNINCRRPQGWIVYPVHFGDTLQSLARETNTTVVGLMVANCMTVNTLTMDQEIYLPYYPGSATATRTITRTPTRTRTRTPTIPGAPTSNPVDPTATFTNPPRPTNTPTPTLTVTKNPLFKDTPTPSNTPQPTDTSPPPTDTEIPPTEETTP